MKALLIILLFSVSGGLISHFYADMSDIHKPTLKAHLIKYKGEKFQFNDDVIFFTEGSDTLNFFCVIRDNKPIRGNNNYFNNVVSVLIRFDYRLPDLHNQDYAKNCDPSDIGCFQNFNRSNNVSIQNQLYLLDKSIKFMKTLNDSINISMIDVQMLYAGDAELDISGDYFESKKHNEDVSLKEFEELISQSKYYQELKSILLDNGISVDGASPHDGIFLPCKTGDFLIHNIVSDPENLPDSVLEFFLQVYLSPLESK